MMIKGLDALSVTFSQFKIWDNSLFFDYINELKICLRKVCY